MLAETTDVVAEHAEGFTLNTEMLIVITNVLLFLATLVTVIYMARDARRHRAEAQAEAHRHEEHVVDSIEEHDEQELVRMAHILEKVLEDQKAKAAAPEHDTVTPNLRSAS